MGVGSKAEADARLAALKAEMRGEVRHQLMTVTDASCQLACAAAVLQCC